jgi:hypothetical protein
MDDVRTDNCPQIVRELDGSAKDPRVCPVMSRTIGHSLLWRRDGDSTRVLVYAVPEKQARLWVVFRRNEVGFLVSSVPIVR